MPSRDSSHHRDLSRRPVPQSSRDLSLYTNQEIDQLRRSNAEHKVSTAKAIKLFFWNPAQKTVCYRTGQSWLFIMSFYPIFLALVLAYFYGNMRFMQYCIETFANENPVVDKRSLTNEPTYQ